MKLLFFMAGWFPLFLGLLLSVVLNISESQTLSFSPDKGTRVTISRQRAMGSDCTVCITEGSKRQCSMETILSGTHKTSVEFTCPHPHQFFTVEINGRLPEPLSSLQLAFSGIGMRQVLPSEMCPGGRRLDPATFHVSVDPKIKTLALVKVTLPSGSSVNEFFSPNYPGSFPDDDLMTWEFHVPSQHNITVRFLKYTEPRCVKKDVVVEYRRTGSAFIGKSLVDPQPSNRQGNFSLSLRNCEMVKKDTPGLTLHFQVSVVKISMQEFCDVDLRKEEGVRLRIEKKGSKSNCRMKKDSVVQETIIIASGKIYNLYFQDCSSEDLMLTINKTIECQQSEKCPVGRVHLSVPALQACLPAPRSITWHLRAPEDGTVELLHPRGNLQQLLLDQPCNANFSLTVNEDDGVTVGSFCPKGPIHKIQVHSNVSVTATPTANGDLSQASKSFLDISFRKDISERYIFAVVPQKGVPVFLATPSWPAGMKAHSTVSWIVSVPEAYHAVLLFLNVSQPKCENRHTVIKVQTLGSREEMFSRREDEKAEDELKVPESFYLNMSNCLPEHNEFSVRCQITLEKKTSHTLGIILGTISALLLLMVLVLIVVCVVIRNKKKQLLANVSIYNPNGGAPGHHQFPKSREDNESHIYASIEDSVVYGHLLQESDYPPHT
ncbi:hypothetical protein SKAU_G00218730 [Synaphobranchus kaupii]|uniref:CUB domain containing protein 1 n=1 Tax=Synaphobranchus kaupii TaxID=118154 RepID=A0A9Q1FAW7_SYNKA|nr:hypothetical protein SKAU_G00218730 [Synaphobranchus kaupii]